MIEEKKILHLTLKKKWFDMIASGEKKEEYREITQYWWTRLIDTYNPDDGEMITKDFDTVEFRNGYGNHVPTVQVELDKIRIGNNGNTAWGLLENAL